jgi:hypothetical protein
VLLLAGVCLLENGIFFLNSSSLAVRGQVVEIDAYNKNAKVALQVNYDDDDYLTWTKDKAGFKKGPRFVKFLSGSTRNDLQADELASDVAMISKVLKSPMPTCFASMERWLVSGFILS